MICRLHLYSINGYGPREWSYVKNLPQLVLAKVGDGIDSVLDRVDDELLNRNLIKSKPGDRRKANVHSDL